MAQSRIIDPKTGKPFRLPQEPGRAAHLRHRGPSSRYDAAQTNDDNKRHWANADSLSPRAANSLDVRVKLRTRSRYEVANNGYGKGLVLTLANDTIGTGPRLQVLLPDAGKNRTVEALFSDWADAVGLGEKLHTAGMAKPTDGEAFLGFATDEELAHLDGTDCPVKLDLTIMECDMISTPWGHPAAFKPGWVDGIELDRKGKPAWYHVLREHPGDNHASAAHGEYDRVHHSQIVHWFRKDRPGQARGIPELTPGLPIGAQMRRWTLATLTAAETAADMAILLKTAGPPDTGDDTADDDGVDPGATFEIQRGLMMRLPDGTDATGFKSEQPQTTYPMLKGELLRELGRPVCAPYNVAAGDSSPYNFSSARMDVGMYRASILIERERCRRQCLERIFGAWYREARLIPGYLPEGLPERLPHKWSWPGFYSIDPLKDALADTERLANGTRTYAAIYAEEGLDWDEQFQQQALEKRRREELGLAPAPSAAAAPPGDDGSGRGRDTEDDAEDEGSPRRPSEYRLRAESTRVLREEVLRG